MRLFSLIGFCALTLALAVSAGQVCAASREGGVCTIIGQALMDLDQTNLVVCLPCGSVSGTYGVPSGPTCASPSALVWKSMIPNNALIAGKGVTIDCSAVGYINTIWGGDKICVPHL